jgi:hypothetical protein
VFVETNSATKVSAANDVIAPSTRHNIFHKMGMRLLDFDYVQAPLTKDKSKVSAERERERERERETERETEKCS